MSSGVFVDTNVFVYVHDKRNPLKQIRSLEWLERLWSEGAGRTGIQVINECYWNLTRKITPPLAADKAWDFVHSLFEWNPQTVDSEVLTRARVIEQSHRLSWWDSLIVAAAQVQRCAILLTEDLQDGMAYDGVTVRNPFRMETAEMPAHYSTSAAAPRPYRNRGRPRSAMAKGR